MITKVSKSQRTEVSCGTGDGQTPLILIFRTKTDIFRGILGKTFAWYAFSTYLQCFTQHLKGYVWYPSRNKRNARQTVALTTWRQSWKLVTRSPSHRANAVRSEPVLRVNKICWFVTRRASCALPCLVRCVVLCCVASCRVSCVAWSHHVSYALSCVVAFVVSRRRVVSCRVSCIVWFVWCVCVFVVSCVSVARV